MKRKREQKIWPKPKWENANERERKKCTNSVRECNNSSSVIYSRELTLVRTITIASSCSIRTRFTHSHTRSMSGNRKYSIFAQTKWHKKQTREEEKKNIWKQIHPHKPYDTKCHSEWSGHETQCIPNTHTHSYTWQRINSFAISLSSVFASLSAPSLSHLDSLSKRQSISLLFVIFCVAVDTTQNTHHMRSHAKTRNKWKIKKRKTKKKSFARIPNSIQEKRQIGHERTKRKKINERQLPCACRCCSISPSLSFPSRVNSPSAKWMIQSNKTANKRDETELRER